MIQKKSQERLFVSLIILFIALVFALSAYKTAQEVTEERDLGEAASYLSESLLTKAEALKIGEGYLRSNRLVANLEEYQKGIFMEMNGTTLLFLEKALGAKKSSALIEEKNISFFSYRIHFFKEYGPTEYIISIDSWSGRVEQLEIKNSTMILPSIGGKEAKVKAMVFLRGQGFYPENLEEKKYFAFEESGQLGHSFLFEIKESTIPSGWGNAHEQISMEILGSEISRYEHSFSLPDAFLAYVDERIKFADKVDYLSLALDLLIVLSAALLLFIYARRGVKMPSKPYLFLALGLFGIVMLDMVNNAGSFLGGYVSGLPLGLYLSILALFMIGVFLFYALQMFLSSRMGDFFAKEVFGKRFTLSRWLESPILSREVSQSIAMGYLVGFFGISVTILIGLLFEDKVAFLATESSYTYLISAIPLLSVFLLSVYAAVSEEVLTRLFGISVLKKFTQSTIVAVIIANLIWAFAHISYYSFPWYYKVSTIFLMGLMLSYFYLRYNLLVVIVGHYIIDIVALGLPYVFMFPSLKSLLGWLLLLLLPLLISLFCRGRKKSEVGKA